MIADPSVIPTITTVKLDAKPSLSVAPRRFVCFLDVACSLAADAISHAQAFESALAPQRQSGSGSVRAPVASPPIDGWSDARTSFKCSGQRNGLEPYEPECVRQELFGCGSKQKKMSRSVFCNHSKIVKLQKRGSYLEVRRRG